MKIFAKNSAIVLVTFALGLAQPIVALAATEPNLGAAASFSILAQTGITGTGTISGDVENNGTGANITALTAAMVGGLIYSSDGVATGGAPPASTIVRDPAVQADAAAEFNVGIPGQGTNGSITGNLDGQTFNPGVYDQGAIILAGGVVTLDGPGVYIFRSAAALTSAGTVNLINGARACDVYWRVQDDAAINGSAFVGTILAGTGIHFGANVTLDGRALAIGGDVSLITDTISGPSCATPTPTATPNNGPSGGGGSFLPTPTPTPTPSPTVIALAATPTPIVGGVLPGAGFGPENGSSIPWNIVIPDGLFALLLSFYFARRKQII